MDSGVQCHTSGTTIAKQGEARGGGASPLLPRLSKRPAEERTEGPTLEEQEERVAHDYRHHHHRGQQD